MFADSEHLLKHASKFLHPRSFNSCQPWTRGKFAAARSQSDDSEGAPLCGYFLGASIPSTDIALLEAVSHQFPLRVIGPVDGGVDLDRSRFSRGTEFVGPQPHERLPELLRDVRVLLLPYKRNEFTKAVLPAKTFECLATGKPTVAIGIPSLEQFAPYFYCSPDERHFFRNIAEGLGEEPQLAQRRVEFATANGWDARMDGICSIIDRLARR